jgi:hypothetical protein
MAVRDREAGRQVQDGGEACGGGGSTGQGWGKIEWERVRVVGLGLLLVRLTLNSFVWSPG